MINNDDESDTFTSQDDKRKGVERATPFLAALVLASREHCNKAALLLVALASKERRSKVALLPVKMMSREGIKKVEPLLSALLVNKAGSSKVTLLSAGLLRREVALLDRKAALLGRVTDEKVALLWVALSVLDLVGVLLLAGR